MIVMIYTDNVHISAPCNVLLVGNREASELQSGVTENSQPSVEELYIQTNDKKGLVEQNIC